METRQFIAVWGEWDESAPNQYDFESQMTDFEFYTESNYEDEDIAQISELEIDQVWNCPLGNHKVIRVA